MRGGSDRDQVGDRVDAVRAAGRQDGREALGPHRGAEVAPVQVHVLGAGELHPPGDRLGDDVPRRQLVQLVLPDHEAHAVGVHQVRALAADRLGDQRLLALGVRAEPQHGRVELDELQVGHLGPGAQRQRHAVTGGDGRVGGGGEHLAHAAGGQHHRPGADRADAVALALAHHVQGQAGRVARRVGQQVEHQCVLDQLDARVGAHRLDQRPRYLRTGGVAAGVRDPAAVVTALAGQQDLALVVLVEGRAGGDQVPDRVRALGDQGAHGLLVAEPGTGHQGVGEVLLGGVAGPQGGGDAALGPAGGAVVEHRLGDHHGPQAGLAGVERDGEAGHPGADHDDVGGRGPAGGGSGQAVRRHGFTCSFSARRSGPRRRHHGTRPGPATRGPPGPRAAGRCPRGRRRRPARPR